MKDPRATDDALAADLRAFRASTELDLPSREDTVRASRPNVLEMRERRIVRTMRILKRRPALTTLAGATALAVALIFVPISYERTVGHDVTLDVRGAPLGDARLQSIANELKTSLGADGVKVLASPSGTRLEVFSPMRSRSEVDEVAITIANGLAGSGFRSSARVEPRAESISGNVWAYAGDRVIELTIHRDGRSSAEIEADLRRQLEDAGFENPEVSVQLSGDETSIEIGGRVDEGGGDEKQIQLRIEQRGDAAEETTVRMQHFERAPGMTDEEFRADIVRQLEDMGVENPQVTVDGDRVEIHAERRIEQ